MALARNHQIQYLNIERIKVPLSLNDQINNSEMELKTLENGDQYKITTKKWLSPSGKWVNDTKGIVPDVEIQLDEKYIKKPSDETDGQLQSAINLTLENLKNSK